MASRSESNASQLNKTRPERLRKACNGCTAAKVKCSGERIGCSRCSNLKIQCVYQESRVGREPGIRAKKKNNQAVSHETNRQGIRGHQTTNRPRQRDQSPLGLSRPLHREASLEVLDESIAHWTSGIESSLYRSESETQNTQDLFHGELNLDFISASHSNEHQQGPVRRSLLSSGANFEFDTIERPYSDSSHIASDANSFSGIQGTPTSPSSSRSHIENATQTLNSAARQIANRPVSQAEFAPHVDLQCIIGCSQMIESLEGYVDARIQPLDLALSLVEKAKSRLYSILEHQKSSPSRRCLILCVVLVDQMLALLETAIASFVMSTSQTNPSSSLFSNSRQKNTDLGAIDFSFGPFSIEPRQKHQYRARLAFEELQQVAELHNLIVRLSRLAGEPLGSSQGPGEQLISHEVLAQRLRHLQQEMEQIAGPQAPLNS